MFLAVRLQINVNVGIVTINHCLSVTTVCFLEMTGCFSSSTIIQDRG